jgi:hypothetical protein
MKRLAVLVGVLLLVAYGSAFTDPSPADALVRVDSLDLRPALDSLRFGDEGLLAATCYNQYDDAVRCAGGVTWTVRDTTRVLPITTKDTIGHVFPRDTGSTYIVASAGAGRGKDSTKIVVTSGPPDAIPPTTPPPELLATVTIAPDTVTLVAAQTQQFTAIARNTHGGVMVTSIGWAETGGAIDGAGLYTAGSTAGTYLVIASVGAYADTATVTIPAPPTLPPPGTGTLARMADSVVELVSVQTHIGSGGVYSNSTAVYNRLTELGVRHIRQRITNPTMSTADSTRLEALAAAGITVTAGCWPQSGNYTSAAHCITQANRLGTNVIDAFDGWNEVDAKLTSSTWPAAFTTWQQTQYAAYNANPTWQDTPVFANSLAHAVERRPVVEPVGLHGLREHALVSHERRYPEQRVEQLDPQWNKIDGSKPEVATETGYHTCETCTASPGVSMQAQAKYLARLPLEYFNRGVFRASLYELLDEGTSTTSREDHWGLINYSGSVKPSFTTLKNLLALLDDPGVAFTPTRLNYSLAGALTSTHSVLLQKRGGTFYLVLWQEVSSYNVEQQDQRQPGGE